MRHPQSKAAFTFYYFYVRRPRGAVALRLGTPS